MTCLLHDIMVALTEKHAEVEQEMIAYFKSQGIHLTCKTSGNTSIVVMQFSMLTRGWLWNSNKAAFTVFFQSGMEIVTKKVGLSLIGIIIQDVLAYDTYFENITHIIKKYFPAVAIERHKDVPAGAF